jgi:hypothetical protein
MACKLYEFTVEGRGFFPIDMLRYDACWPMTQEDVCRMTLDGTTRGMMPADRPAVKVRMASHREPTAARWASFGWKVVAQERPRKL